MFFEGIPAAVYLKAKDPLLFGKLVELRESVEQWLTYIPQTFPHYTRHTVGHSDEILRQISKLLFDGDGRPATALSAVELYVMAAACYLHDAGMVVADAEKSSAIKSEDFTAWTTTGAGAARWASIQKFRAGAAPGDDALRHFLADVQVRYLLSDYFRRSHHRRGAAFLSQHQSQLGRFAFDDPALMRTIADVCLAHGLDRSALEDSYRFPDRRDIRGEPVSVRFAAIMLRLGDLLDLSHDRACPLLLNAAGKLPADSLAHWSQYQRITHRLTAPDRIELTAECQTQDEHRVLQDWCQWLVEECRHAATLMAKSVRHANWRPPVVAMDGEHPTIRIQPATGAQYRPVRWVIQLDPDRVLERLVHDLYKERLTFLRELIQNGLDAMRAQMYADLEAAAEPRPNYPYEAPESWREQYCLKIEVTSAQEVNAVSGELETRQIIAVDDCGIGMDSDVIEGFFLQVGRSYYQSDDFKRRFGFVPTSRFGIGFLSVFAVSDHVTVDTCKPASLDGPFRLTLTGPRNYLLTEKGTRCVAGTRVEVRLATPIDHAVIEQAVRNWCVRVEFPISLEVAGNRSEIRAECAKDFERCVPAVSEPDATIRITAYPIRQPGVQGEIYMLSKVDSTGERLAWTASEQATYVEHHPEAWIPSLPPSVRSFHGLAVGAPASGRAFAFRLDYRRPGDDLSLAREKISRYDHVQQETTVREALLSVLERHLQNSRHATESSRWRYIEKLAQLFPLDDYWEGVSEGVVVYVDGRLMPMAFDDVCRAKTIRMLVDQRGMSPYSPETQGLQRWPRALLSDCEGGSVLVVTENLLQEWFANARLSLWRNRRPSRVTCAENAAAVEWSLDASATRLTLKSGSVSFFPVPSFDVDVVAVPFNAGSWSGQVVLLNGKHPFTRWLLRVHTAGEGGHTNYQRREEPILKRLLETVLLHTPPVGLNNYLARWNEMDLPADLRCPVERLEHEQVQWPAVARLLKTQSKRRRD
jgi:hypothetical protein